MILKKKIIAQSNIRQDKLADEPITTGLPIITRFPNTAELLSVCRLQKISFPTTNVDGATGDMVRKSIKLITPERLD